MRKLLREHGLAIAAATLFALTLVGQVLTGNQVYNDDQEAHGEQPVGLVEYLETGHFGEALFENWESEFLQMGVFVLLTVFLRQKGSPESKSLDEEGEEDREPDPNRPDAPWPVRVGGAISALYSHSLTIALFGLFFVAFVLHAFTGAEEYSAEQQAHGQPGVDMVQYLTTSQMWFESFQNWQSEFMSIGALIVLSIFLRQKGSPQSKPVDEAISTTGG
jgi:hypothetical protein